MSAACRLEEQQPRPVDTAVRLTTPPAQSAQELLRIIEQYKRALPARPTARAGEWPVKASQSPRRWRAPLPVPPEQPH